MILLLRRRKQAQAAGSDGRPRFAHFVGCPKSGSRAVPSLVPKLFTINQGDKDELTEWNGEGGRTYLWGYVQDVMRQTDVRSAVEKYWHENNEKTDVLIITDGEDNESSNEYNGKFGFKPLVQWLTAQGFLDAIRISILFVGSSSNKGEDDQLRDAYQALATQTGGFFVRIESAPDVRTWLGPRAIVDAAGSLSGEAFDALKPQAYSEPAKYLVYFLNVFERGRFGF